MLLFILLLLLAFIVPLALTKYLNNQSDLPKNAALQFFGAVFVISVIVRGYFSGNGQNSIADRFQHTSPMDPYVLVFLFIAVAVTIFSVNPAVSFYGQYERQIGLVTILMLGLIYFYSRVVLEDESRLRKLILVMETAAVLVSVYAILQRFGIDPLDIQPPGVKRPVSFSGNAVFAGGFLSLVLPFAILNTSLKKNKILRITFPVLIFSGILVTGTRSAYLAVLTAVISIALLYPLLKEKPGKLRIPKRSLISITAVLFAGVLFILLFPENQFVKRFLSIFAEGDNTRMYLWRDSLNIFYEYPLFGPGIGMFPNALEEYYSIRLKKDEILRIFDNAHNNYLHALCTMGVTGFLSYTLMLASGVVISIKGFFRKDTEKNKRILFLSIFASLAAYMVYGLTNFDDISILLYLFLIFGILGSITLKSKTGSNLKISAQKLRLHVSSTLIVIFCIFCIYNSFMLVWADRSYLEGVKAFEVYDIKQGVGFINDAVNMQPESGYYRYGLSSNVYNWAITKTGSNLKMKNDLLNQAEQEMLRARKNFKSEKECDVILALINYHLGITPKADSIKYEVLNKDPISINFRLRLAEYYLNINDPGSAKENLEEIEKTGYVTAEILNARGYLFMKTGKPEEAKAIFLKVLEIESGNVFAKEMLGRIQK